MRQDLFYLLYPVYFFYLKVAEYYENMDDKYYDNIKRQVHTYLVYSGIYQSWFFETVSDDT